MLESLKSKARPMPELESAQLPTFVVRSDDEARAAISTMIDYFGSSTAHSAVRVEFGPRTVGYLVRADMDEYLGPKSKGFGDSARASLPGLLPTGTALEFEFRCPVPDCPVSPVFLLTFREAPRCRIHHTELELANEP